MFKSLCFTVLLFILVACGSNDLTVSTEFTNTQDVNSGSLVYLDGKVVGEVTDVVSSNKGTQVEISIQPESVELIDSNAAVVINRLKQSAPIEIYNRGKRTGPIQAGQSLTGLDSMFQLGAWMVGDAIQVGSSSVSEYVDAFQKYLQGEQFQQDKQQVQQQINAAQTAARKTIESVNTEMNSAIKELSQLEEPAAQAVEQFGDELSPVLEELAKSGSAVIQELEKLTQSLEQAQQQEQQAGENFLSSLLATLEKLNDSVASGLEQSDPTAQDELPVDEK